MSETIQPRRIVKPLPREVVRPHGLFPHTLDHVVRRMPHNQRFEVTWPAPLGPWTKGDVIERHVDLVGAQIPRLLELGAIKATDKPAYKAPQTVANLVHRAAKLARNIPTLENATGEAIPAPMKPPEPLQMPTGKVTG